MAAGRPSHFTPEISLQICEQIATSNKSMKTICDELGLKVISILNWLSEGHEGHKPQFCTDYARAKEMQADFLAEEILAIADDGSNDYMTIEKGDKEYNVENKEVTNRSRLRVDSRKWIASKLKPKRYGDKIEIDGNIKNDTPINAELLAALTAKLNK